MPRSVRLNRSLTFILLMSKVFTVPQATIETRLLCALVGRGNPNRRNTFDGLYYKFHIAALTENSSISYGAQTTDICK